jgi:hypothetical protein
MARFTRFRERNTSGYEAGVLQTKLNEGKGKIETTTSTSQGLINKEIRIIIMMEESG